MSTPLFQQEIETPIGKMDAFATDNGLCLLEFRDRKELNTEITALEEYYESNAIPQSNAHLALLKKELEGYFNEELQTFTTPVILHGTDFQKKVWQALTQILYGATRTYKEQTAVLGDPKAIRAVAAANGKNKIAIVVPCHRVIGSDGSLTGYAGGLDRKRFLLNLERKVAGPRDLFSV